MEREERVRERDLKDLHSWRHHFYLIPLLLLCIHLYLRTLLSSCPSWIYSPSLSSLSLLSGSLGVYHGRLSLTQIYLTSVESSMCLMGWGLPVYRQPYEDATMPDSGESCPEGAWHDACNHGARPSPSLYWVGERRAKWGRMRQRERELEELSFSSL